MKRVGSSVMITVDKKQMITMRIEFTLQGTDTRRRLKKYNTHKRKWFHVTSIHLFPAVFGLMNCVYMQ